MVDNLGELVWATHPDFDPLEGLLERLREHAAGFLADAGIGATLDFPDAAPERRVTGEVRRHLTLAFKEALTNAVKHAGATRVDVVCRLRGTTLELTVTDDGRGFDGSGVGASSAGGGGARSSNGKGNTESSSVL